MDARQRLDTLLDDPELRDSALAQLCRELISDQQRLHQRLERISRISDRYQAELRNTNKDLAETNARLTTALSEVRTLSGFIPICSRCKKVRDDSGFWDDVEGYLGKHSDVVLSQGCCPACAAQAAGAAPPPSSSEGDDPVEAAKLDSILATPQWDSHPLRGEYERLSRDYQKLGRRLHKISRISDGFQTQMKELNLALARASRTDPLTGLANRRALLEQLEHHAAEAVRGNGFGVAMVDVDHFKRVNDSLGHAVGDTVLRALAQRLAAITPEPALAGRWGGEEFLLILPGYDHTAIAAFCETARAAIEALEVEHSQRRIRVTVSVGIALHDRTLSFEDTIRDADRALYAAKSCGRNRVMSGEEL
jgi:diguanylate cyclase (GGDEF)-like protein